MSIQGEFSILDINFEGKNKFPILLLSLSIKIGLFLLSLLNS